MSIVYDEAWYKAQMRYQEAVKRAGFLTKDEKISWSILGGSLTFQELQGAERSIINEDLRRLNVRHQLHQLKPTMEVKK